MSWSGQNEASFRAFAACSRLLIALTAALLLIMPFTAYFCNFDRFLRGGQDFEFGLLTLAAILLLTLLLLQKHGPLAGMPAPEHSRQARHALMRNVLSGHVSNRVSGRVRLLQSFVPGVDNLPLKI